MNEIECGKDNRPESLFESRTRAVMVRAETCLKSATELRQRLNSALKNTGDSEKKVDQLSEASECELLGTMDGIAEILERTESVLGDMHQRLVL